MINKEEEADRLFLDLLEKDIKENFEQCKPIDPNLILYVQSLFKDEVIDVDRSIIDEE